MAKSVSSAATSLFQTLRRFMKKPWEITGPCASPEYRSAVPLATEYRPVCPATIGLRPEIPNSDPENVFDIKYFPRDQRRNRPPIKRTLLYKADLEKMKSEATFDVANFPPVYLTSAHEEDYNAKGGGYQ